MNLGKRHKDENIFIICYNVYKSSQYYNKLNNTSYC